MSTLTRKEIIHYMNNKLIKDRLIITPLINPNESFDPVSVNVRLGSEFIVMRKQTFPLLDIADLNVTNYVNNKEISDIENDEYGKSEEEEKEKREKEENYKNKLYINIERYQEKIRLRLRQEFILHPHQLIIGSTLEYISLPCNLMCYVIGKSSWGRMGLIIATATKVDPGFKGTITLEIINEGEVPIILYPGIPIAQLVFHKTIGKTKYKGKYDCPTGPQFPDFTDSVKKWKFWLPQK